MYRPGLEVYITLHGSRMNQAHPVLDEFVQACQQRYTCYFLATHHMDAARTQFAHARPGNRVFIGPGEPGTVPVTASMDMVEAREKMRRDGEFADALAKALLVAIYSDWDEHFRIFFSQAVGARKNHVRCDLMGDLRHIRNCIVHERSNLSSELNLRCLSWKLPVGPLIVTGAMFTEFMTQVNTMHVRVES